MRKSEPVLAYYWFLNSCYIADARAGVRLEPEVLRLLEEVAQAERLGTPLLVSQLMQRADIASPATICRRIAMLKHDGWLISSVVEGDTRIKPLRITAKTKKFFAKRNKLVLAAVENERQLG